jgi:hypothetical protein
VISVVVLLFGLCDQTNKVPKISLYVHNVLQCKTHSVTNSGQKEINNNKQISYSYKLHYWEDFGIRFILVNMITLTKR